MSENNQAAIDRFVDAVWLEDGLSANTLAAYQRDLTALAQWLQQNAAIALDAVQESHLQAYFAARHSLSKATSANRRLTVFQTLLPLGIARTHCVGRPHPQDVGGQASAASAQNLV